MNTLYVLLLIFALAGCGTTHTPHYSLDNVIKSESPIHDMTIGIVLFEDRRSTEFLRFGNNPRFGPSIKFIKLTPGGIESTIIKHFDHVKLFARQAIVDSNMKQPSSDQLTQLKSKGYDAILIGIIEEYIGYRIERSFSERPESILAALPDAVITVVSGTGVPVIVTGPIIASIIENKEKLNCIGYTKLSDLKLIDTTSGHVIWEGQASGGAIGLYTGPKALSIADESLKNAVTDLIEKMKQFKNK
jgi:hypothetical protein